MPKFNSFTIHFEYNKFAYSAEVFKLDEPKDRTYDIAYKSKSVKISNGDFQMYAEQSGNKKLKWKQRRGEPNSIDLDPVFVSLIGAQIENWKNLNSGLVS